MEDSRLLKIQITYKDINHYNSTNNDDVFTWETSYTDTGIDKILDVLYGMFIQLGWQPETITSRMLEFVSEKTGNDYYIYGEDENVSDDANTNIDDLENKLNEANNKIIELNAVIDNLKQQIK